MSLIRRSSLPSNYESVRILVVEDEPKLGRLLVRGLGEEGHPADLAPSGEEALWMARAAPYDAIVLDVMLPGIDGFATCRELRSRGVWTPVLMLTARDAIEDRISRARHRGRRLPRQAVRLQRAARAAARDRAACAGGAADRAARRRPAARPGHPPCVARRDRARPDRKGVRAARGVHAAPRRGALAGAVPGRRLGHRVREPLERRRRLRPVPAEKIDRPFGRTRSRRSAASGTG